MGRPGARALTVWRKLARARPLPPAPGPTIVCHSPLLRRHELRRTRTPRCVMRNIMIASYRDRHEGEQARGFLADAGIGSLLHSEPAARPEPMMSDSQVRLFVREDDADRARALLDDANGMVFG